MKDRPENAWTGDFILYTALTLTILVAYFLLKAIFVLLRRCLVRSPRRLFSLPISISFVNRLMDLGYSKHLNDAMCASIYVIDTAGFNSYLSGQSEVWDFPQTDDPVWLLGRQHSSLHQLQELRDDFRSRIWITYRKGFAAIGGNGPTTDQGWGCMLRCGQMVLAQALVMKELGRDWRWMGCRQFSLEDKQAESNQFTSSIAQSGEDALQFDTSFTEINNEEEMQKIVNEKADHDRYLQILKQFQDKKTSPYSIHQIALISEKPVGNWLGPNSIAHALKKLCQFDRQNDITLFVSMDNQVIIDQIKKHCKSQAMVPCAPSTSCSAEGAAWKSLLLFIPLRLGLTEINSVYFKALKTTFMMKQSVGIIGGRPNHALFFIGFCRNEMIYLDPHKTQQAVDLDEFSSGESFCDDSTYHCRNANRMDISQLDPSLSLCFFFKGEKDFDAWCSNVDKFLLYNEKQPLFELCETQLNQMHFSDLADQDTKEYGFTTNISGGDKCSQTTDDEDFEML